MTLLDYTQNSLGSYSNHEFEDCAFFHEDSEKVAVGALGQAVQTLSSLLDINEGLIVDIADLIATWGERVNRKRWIKLLGRAVNDDVRQNVHRM